MANSHSTPLPSREEQRRILLRYIDAIADHGAKIEVTLEDGVQKVDRAYFKRALLRMFEEGKFTVLEKTKPDGSLRLHFVSPTIMRSYQNAAAQERTQARKPDES